MPSLILLGIDAGFTATGLVAVDFSANRVTASRCVRTQPTKQKRGVRVADDDAERCAFLAREIREFLQALRPQVVAVELPGGAARGARAQRAMALATGVVVTVLALGGWAAEWVTPGMGKQAATGKRDGSKAEVEAAVKAHFAWEPGTLPKTAAEREHVCDAAAAVMATEHGALVAAARAMRRGEAGD